MKHQQAGVPLAPAGAVAMPVRAVVVGLAFADQQQERETAARQRDPRFTAVAAVAVDVLVYGGPQRAFLAKVPVLPRRWGINDYAGLWVPRPSTKDLSTGADPVLSRDDGRTLSNPKDLDGDHVIVEFIAGDPTQPYIRDSLPHPRAGHRQLAAAADAWESRFRGVVTKIDANGNVLVDASTANDGTVDNAGAETPAQDAAHGTLTVRLPQHAPLVIEHVNPDGSVTSSRFKLDPDTKKLSFEVDGGAGMTVVDKDANTVATFGNGAVNVAIAQHLEEFYAQIKAALDIYGPHLHPSAMGPTGTPAPPLVMPTWLATIKSGKLKLPDG